MAKPNYFFEVSGIIAWILLIPAIIVRTAMFFDKTITYEAAWLAYGVFIFIEFVIIKSNEKGSHVCKRNP